MGGVIPAHGPAGNIKAVSSMYTQHRLTNHHAQHKAISPAALEKRGQNGYNNPMA